MKIYNTASLTAIWRCMGKVECASMQYVPFHLRIMAKILGMLDPSSVQTICRRTTAINSIITKSRPKTIVEIGSGYSSREQKFSNIKFYQMDLPKVASIKENVIPFDATKDELNIDAKYGFFIVEGLTMYLNEENVKNLLSQIKKYKGTLLIDFFSAERSNKQKSHSEKLYKLLFRMLTGKKKLFDFKIKNIYSGTELLENMGFKKIKYIDYNLEKTLDCLFYAEF